MAHVRPEHVKATVSGLVASSRLAALVIIGSRTLDHFDAALVGYIFAILFAAFGITYRYATFV